MCAYVHKFCMCVFVCVYFSFLRVCVCETARVHDVCIQRVCAQRVCVTRCHTHQLSAEVEYEDMHIYIHIYYVYMYMNIYI